MGIIMYKKMLSLIIIVSSNIIILNSCSFNNYPDVITRSEAKGLSSNIKERYEKKSIEYLIRKILEEQGKNKIKYINEIGSYKEKARNAIPVIRDIINDKNEADIVRKAAYQTIKMIEDE